MQQSNSVLTLFSSVSTSIAASEDDVDETSPLNKII